MPTMAPVLAQAIARVLQPIPLRRLDDGAASWTPALWFLASEQGIWLDPSDFTRYVKELGPELVPGGQWNQGYGVIGGLQVPTGWGTYTPANISSSSVLPNSLQFTATAHLAGFAPPNSNMYNILGRWCEVYIRARKTAVASGTPSLQVYSGAWHEVVGASVPIGQWVEAKIRVLFANTAYISNFTGAASWEISHYSIRELTAINTATMFQDSAGTTPVTAVEQPVGLVLDKRLPATSTAPLDALAFVPAGSTPPTAADTTFLSEACGSITFPANAGGYAVSRGASATTHPIVIGRRYTHSYRIALSRALTGGETLVVMTTGTYGSISSITLNSGTASGVWIDFPNATVIASTNASGSNSCYVYAGTAIASPVTIYVRQYTVREIPGNHASQPTAAARPVLSARKNLLTYSEQDPGLVAGGTTPPTINAAATQLGVGCISITLPSGVAGYAASNAVTTAFTIPVGTYTQSYDVAFSRALTGAEKITCYVQNADAAASTYIEFTSANTSTAFVRVSASINELTSRVCKFGWFVDATLSSPVTVYMTKRQVEPGSTATTYQRVNTATDYDTVGFPHYLKFDGVDDNLVTGNIDFTATDAVTVMAAVQKFGRASAGDVVSLTSDPGVTNGSFLMTAPAFNNSDSVGWGSRGTAYASNNENSAPYGVGYKGTLTGTADISSDTAALRSNGVQLFNATADQGTGNYANAPLYIGRRGGTSVTYNGNLYQLAVRGAATATPDLVTGETFFATKTGISLP